MKGGNFNSPSFHNSTPIHRVILNASSDYFTRTLGPSLHDGKPDEFYLDDTDGETVRQVANFCYTGTINLTEENAGKILKIASRYEIDLLEDKCREYYFAKLKVANAVRMMMMTNKYRFTDPRKRAISLIYNEFDAMAMMDCQKSGKRLFEELLECEKRHEFDDLTATRPLESSQSNEDKHSVNVPDLWKLTHFEHHTAEVRFK